MKVDRLLALAKADNQVALALTDTDNMFGALEFSEKASKEGLQPITGYDLAIDFGDHDPNARNAATQVMPRIVLLATRERGYENLMHLNSRAFIETPNNQAPHIKVEWLEGRSDDLILLTGGAEGPLAQALLMDQQAVATARCEQLLRLFGDRMYIELQRHGTEKERRTEAGLINLAYDLGIPLVATNEPFFATAGDHESHDALMCIASGNVLAETERDTLTPEHRFKTRSEMAVLFADLPEAIANTVEIAQRCAYRPRTRKPILPRFMVGADLEFGDRPGP